MHPLDETFDYAFEHHMLFKRGAVVTGMMAHLGNFLASPCAKYYLIFVEFERPRQSVRDVESDRVDTKGRYVIG